MHACIRHLQVSQLAPAKYHTPELVLTDYLGCRFPVSWADFRLCLCKLCSEADRGRLAGQRREFKTYRKSTPQLIIDHLHSYTLYCVDHTSHESHDKWFDYNTTSLFVNSIWVRARGRAGFGRLRRIPLSVYRRKITERACSCLLLSGPACLPLLLERERAPDLKLENNLNFLRQALTPFVHLTDLIISEHSDQRPRVPHSFDFFTPSLR